MTRMLLSGCTLLLAMLFTLPASAQKVQISVNATELTTDQPLVISVAVSGVSGGSIPRPQFPEVKGLQTGPTSTNQSWINGYSSVTFSLNYLAPAPGTYKVPPMSYKVGTVSAKTDGFTIVFKKGSGQANKPKQQGSRYFDPFEEMMNNSFFGGSRQPQQPLQYKSVEADYFLSVNLDKDVCYLGQQVHGDVVLYVNERDNGKIQADGMAIAEMQQRIKNTGFWQEIIELQEIPAELVTVNGKRYIAYTLYKTVLFPIKSGVIEFKGIYLDGMKLAVAVNASPITRFMGQGTKFDPIKIKAADRKLTVKPLPATDLPDASMVGSFKMDAQLNAAEVQTGGNLELEVRISGDGNMAMISDPVIEFPEGFEAYDPSSQYNSQIKGNGMVGDKSWKWSLLPTRAGDYDLGPLRFFYFDPARAAYDSLVVPELKVKVKGDDIENQRIGKSGTDDFYAAAFSSASAGLSSGNGPTRIVLLLGLLAMAATLGITIWRRRSKPLTEKATAEGDFWKQ